MTPPTTGPTSQALEWVRAVERVDDPAGNTIHDELRATLDALDALEANHD